MTRQRSSDLANSQTVSIRFPRRLYEAIKRRADKNRRSFNAQVLLELESDFDLDEPDTTAATRQ